jgi:hypothetical protein
MHDLSAFIAVASFYRAESQIVHHVLIGDGMRLRLGLRLRLGTATHPVPMISTVDNELIRFTFEP